MKVLLWLLSTIFLIMILFLAAAYFIPRISSDFILVILTILFFPVIIAMMKNK